MTVTTLKPNVEQIPHAMTERPQWIVWQIEPDDDGKPTKVPYQAINGFKAATDKPATWSTFDQAVAAFQADTRWDGIGYVFSAHDPFVFIDLDNCRDKDTGEIEAWAQQIIDELNSFTEPSQSGTGVHIYVEAKKPGTRCETTYATGKIEIYEHKRFGTITGQHLAGTPATIKPRQKQLEALYERIFASQGSSTTQLPSAHPTPSHVTDEMILSNARSATNGAKFAALWNGDISGHDNDQSRADLALCDHLAFWTGPDPARIEQLFDQSGLGREKWYSRADYRDRTISKALEGKSYPKDFYAWPDSAIFGNGKHEPTASTTPAEQPEIHAGEGHLPTITGQAWGALQRANTPAYLFRFGGLPSRIEHDDDGTPSPRTLTDTRLRHELARSADWFKWKKDGEGFTKVAAMPPMPVVQDMLAHPDIPLPILTGIIEAPGFNPDGSLHSKPGYDPAGRTYYAPADGFTVPAISQEPTPADVTQARSLILDELLCDFPFTDQAETAHAVGLLILPFVRGLIDGATPLHLIEKPTPGTGATLLTEVLTYPATGRAITAMTEGRDEDEWRKRITAKLRGGGRELFIDNLKRPLISATLAAAMTSIVWEDRLLGTSDTTRLPIRCTWIATGNNPTLSSEIARRTVRIRLDAKQDRPWQRASFRHADLRGWMKDHRAEIVWAALTLAQAWIAAGRPMPENHQRIGMYESWSDVIGGILAHAGIPGFLSNLDDFYETTDTEGEMIRAFLSGWWETHGDRSVGAADLYEIAADVLDLGDGSDRSQKVKLGNQLKELKDRVYQLSPELTVQIVKGKTVKRLQQWSLKRTLFGDDNHPEQGVSGVSGASFPLDRTAPEDLETAETSQNVKGASVGKIQEIHQIHPDTPSDQQMCGICNRLIPDGPIARARGICNECEAGE